MSVNNLNPAEEAITDILDQLEKVLKQHVQGMPSGDVLLHHDLAVRMQRAGIKLRGLGTVHHRYVEGCTCSSHPLLAV